MSAFLIDLVGGFWAWVITVFFLAIIIIFALSLIWLLLKWIAKLSMKGLSFILLSPFFLLGFIFSLIFKRGKKDDYKSKVDREFEERDRVR